MLLRFFFINKYEAYSDDLILHFEEISFLLPIKNFHWLTRKKSNDLPLMGRVVKHVKSALDQSSNKKVKEKNIKYKRNQGKRRCCDMICYFGKEIKKN